MKVLSTTGRGISFALMAVLAGGGLAAPPAAEDLQRGSGGDCSGFEVVQQPLEPSGLTVRLSDQGPGIQVLENVVDEAGTMTALSGSVSGLRWWGIDVDGSGNPCDDEDQAGTPFDIVFRDGDLTGPADVIAVLEGVSPILADSGVSFGLDSITEYSAVFDPLEVTGSTWIGIERRPGVAAGCSWNWVTENVKGTYDDALWQQSLKMGDLALCVAGSVVFEDGFESGNTAAWGPGL